MHSTLLYISDPVKKGVGGIIWKYFAGNSEIKSGTIVALLQKK